MIASLRTYRTLAAELDRRAGAGAALRDAIAVATALLAMTAAIPLTFIMFGDAQ